MNVCRFQPATSNIRAPINTPPTMKKTQNPSGIKCVLDGAAMLACVALISLSQARAADATWNVDENGTWNTDSNWTPASAPGATTGTTSTDIATFGGTITAARTITADANRNIGGITFNYNFTGSGNGYVLGGNLLLSNGGVIQEISTVTPSGSRISRFANDIYIQGDGGSATIRSTAASGNVRMIVNAVHGTSTTGNTTTLFLDGTNTAPNSIGSSILNGANGGELAIVKNGTGIWRLTNNSSDFSGGTTLNAGSLQHSAFANVFGTGALTINGGTLQVLDDGVATIANSITVGGNFTIAGRTLSNTTYSGAVDLGGATRTITTSGQTGSNIRLSGVLSNGGLTKIGNETLVLGGVNTYAGDTTVNAGTLILADNAGMKFVIGANGVNNRITGTGAVTLDGDFTFDLTGAAIADGNMWNIVDVGTLNETYGATFSVNDFADGGSGIWTKSDGDNVWTFTESTGVLGLGVIPEPNVALLLTIGVGMLLFRSRSRKAA